MSCLKMVFTDRASTESFLEMAESALTQPEMQLSRRI
jgi:hypothetical protein